MRGEGLKTIVYTGSSMYPSLKSADVLSVVHYAGRKILCGDVIVFRTPDDKCTVTHRIVRIDSRGIKTRGDNSSSIDPWMLSPDNIVGRVVCAQRGNMRHSISGGLKGLLYPRIIRGIRMIDLKVSLLFHPTYHRLARAGVLRRWLPTRLETRIVSFDGPRGSELQLFIGHRVIGKLASGSNEWIIRRPFRLFVDEESLPKHKIRK